MFTVYALHELHTGSREFLVSNKTQCMQLAARKVLGALKMLKMYNFELVYKVSTSCVAW